MKTSSERERSSFQCEEMVRLTKTERCRASLRGRKAMPLFWGWRDGDSLLGMGTVIKIVSAHIILVPSKKIKADMCKHQVNGIVI